jgi:hypothetical protein
MAFPHEVVTPKQVMQLMWNYIIIQKSQQSWSKCLLELKRWINWMLSTTLIQKMMQNSHHELILMIFTLGYPQILDTIDQYNQISSVADKLIYGELTEIMKSWIHDPVFQYPYAISLGQKRSIRPKIPSPSLFHHLISDRTLDWFWNKLNGFGIVKKKQSSLSFLPRDDVFMEVFDYFSQCAEERAHNHHMMMLIKMYLQSASKHAFKLLKTMDKSLQKEISACDDSCHDLYSFTLAFEEDGTMTQDNNAYNSQSRAPATTPITPIQRSRNLHLKRRLAMLKYLFPKILEIDSYLSMFLTRGLWHKIPTNILSSPLKIPAKYMRDVLSNNIIMLGNDLDFVRYAYQYNQKWSTSDSERTAAIQSAIQHERIQIAEYLIDPIESVNPPLILNEEDASLRMFRLLLWSYDGSPKTWATSSLLLSSLEQKSSRSMPQNRITSRFLTTTFNILRPHQAGLLRMSQISHDILRPHQDSSVPQEFPPVMDLLTIDLTFALERYQGGDLTYLESLKGIDHERAYQSLTHALNDHVLLHHRIDLVPVESFSQNDIINMIERLRPKSLFHLGQLTMRWKNSVCERLHPFENEIKKTLWKWFATCDILALEWFLQLHDRIRKNWNDPSPDMGLHHPHIQLLSRSNIVPCFSYQCVAILSQYEELSMHQQQGTPEKNITQFSRALRRRWFYDKCKKYGHPPPTNL